MSTVKDRIFNFLRDRPLKRFSDSEIHKTLGIKRHQQVNESCRQLAVDGKIIRLRIDGLLLNYYKEGLEVSAGADEESLQRVVLVIVKDEDFIKVRELLENAEIEFFVNDPLIRFGKVSGVKMGRLL